MTGKFYFDFRTECSKCLVLHTKFYDGRMYNLPRRLHVLLNPRRKLWLLADLCRRFLPQFIWPPRPVMSYAAFSGCRSIVRTPPGTFQRSIYVMLFTFMWSNFLDYWTNLSCSQSQVPHRSISNTSGQY